MSDSKQQIQKTIKDIIRYSSKENKKIQWSKGIASDLLFRISNSDKKTIVFDMNDLMSDYGLINKDTYNTGGFPSHIVKTFSLTVKQMLYFKKCYQKHIKGNIIYSIFINGFKLLEKNNIIKYKITYVILGEDNKKRLATNKEHNFINNIKNEIAKNMGYNHYIQIYNQQDKKHFWELVNDEMIKNNILNYKKAIVVTYLLNKKLPKENFKQIDKYEFNIKLLDYINKRVNKLLDKLKDKDKFYLVVLKTTSYYYHSIEKNNNKEN